MVDSSLPKDKRDRCTEEEVTERERKRAAGPVFETVKTERQYFIEEGSLTQDERHTASLAGFAATIL